LIAGTGYGLRGFFVRSAPRPFAHFSITQATNSGTASLASISPDGKYLLFTKRENGLESLWLRNVPTSSDTQVVAPSPAPFASLSFSPDGNYLYFRQAGDKTGLYDVLYRAPVLGGTPKLLVRDVDAHPVFSPDSQRMIFIRCNNPEAGKCRWLSANPDGSNEQLLLSRTGGMPQELTWSPDGKRLAFSSGFGSVQETQTMSAFDVDKNHETPLFSFADKRVTGVRWTPDGRGILILYFDKTTNFNSGQVGYISYPDGRFEPVTNDTNNYDTLSLSGDGRTLTTIQSQQVAELDTLPAMGGAAGSPIPGLAKQLQQGIGVAWLSNSEFLLVQPNRILRVSSDGAKQTELFRDASVTLAPPLAVCGGGHSIVVRMRGREGKDTAPIWRMDADGANLKRLSDGEDDFWPVCSVAGKWVYFVDGKADRRTRVPLEGGPPEVLPAIGVPGTGIRPFSGISRDDRMLATFETVVDKTTSTYKSDIVIINSTSLNAPPLILPADPRITLRTLGPQFTPDGSAVVYVIRGQNNVDNLWLQPLDGRPGRQITQFNSEQIPGFFWSPDGKKLLVARWHEESDVVLLRDTSK
jgi:eukaryotic-like serine/threonine-protein kinase